MSDLHDSQYIQNGRNQNQYDAHRRHILDNHHKELFGLELPALCDFVDQCLGLDAVSHKYAGQERHHRHHHTVGDEVEEVEQLRADKAAAELAAKQQELTRFAEAQGLDAKEAAIAEAIQKADYAALVAESMKKEKTETKPVVASYAMGGGITAKGEYDDLLGKA